jgi:2-amino-4-hydroxy-6-hydroxymethyldihydropteridine diphosphokinase
LILAYIGIGSNIGDRSANIARAFGEMSALRGTIIKKKSPIFETDPVGPPQPDFLNAACSIETELEARELLSELKAIERRIGREEHAVRWGPRLIDLDLLVYGDLVIDEDGLVLPHPEMTKREFVMVPLLAIDPDLELPSGEPLAAYSSPSHEGVRPFGPD